MGATEDAQAVSRAQRDAREFGYMLVIHRKPGAGPMSHQATIAPLGHPARGKTAASGRSALAAATAALDAIRRLAAAD